MTSIKNQIDKLLKSVDDYLYSSKEYTLLFPFENQKLVANLHEYAKIIDKKYLDNGVQIKAIINEDDLYKIENFIKGSHLSFLN